MNSRCSASKMDNMMVFDESVPPLGCVRCGNVVFPGPSPSETSEESTRRVFLYVFIRKQLNVGGDHVKGVRGALILESVSSSSFLGVSMGILVWSRYKKKP